MTDKFLEGIPQAQKTILVSSFAASVRRNQFGKTRKHIILHGTVKSTISDVSASFRTYLRSDPTLESSGQKYLILQQQLRGSKMIDPTTKHQKAIPERLVLHIYKPTNTPEHSHWSTDHKRIFLRHAVIQVLYYSLRGGQMHRHPSKKGYEFL